MFERNPEGSSSESAAEFYQHYEDSEQKNAALKNLEGEDLAKYQKDNQAALSQYSTLTAAHKEISGLQKQSKQIYTDTNMTADQKTAEIQNINNQISHIAKSANIQYNRATKGK